MMGASSSAMHAHSRSAVKSPGPGPGPTPLSSEREASREGFVEVSTNVDNGDRENSKEQESKEDFDEVLGKLNLPEHNLKSAKNIMKKNIDIQDELFNGLKTVECMKNGTDYDSYIYVEKMNYNFFNVSMEKRVILGDFLKEVGFPLASYQKYKQVLKASDQEFLDEDKLKQGDASQMIAFIRGHWWNYSDCCLSFASSLITHGVVQEMVEDLKNLIGVDEKTIKMSFTFESAIGTLHNVAKLESQRQTFRDLKLVDILGNFLQYENAPKITMLVLLTLALIIDESQTDLLFSHESSFDLLIRLAKRAWKSRDHRYDGFSIDELVLGLKGLSKNDKVKRLLVDKDILTLVSAILDGGNAEEKEIAAKLLWELSFDATNKSLILKNETIMKTLKTISKSTEKIARVAQGVLWVLEMARKTEQEKNTPEEKNKTPLRAQGHIMISYNWDNQKPLLQVKDALKQQGFNVWMDVDNISGSTLQAMAEAVEGASMVLVCMSERYKESTNCRSEAEYAFNLEKPIIPLLMQESYKPDGWLGILLGTKLFFDFSGKFSFDAKLSELEKELVGRGISSKAGSDDVDGPIVRESAPLVGKPPSKSKSQNMTQVEVKAWVLKHKLGRFPLFNSMETNHLSFLKKLSMKAPEFYYSFLMDLMQEKKTMEDLNHLMQVTSAIGELPL